MPESLLASGKNITKYISSSRNFAFDAVSKSYALKTRNSSVTFNFSSLVGYNKIIFKVRRISGNGIVFVQIDNFIKKITVSNEMNIEIPFDNHIKFFKNNDCLGEFCFLSITGTHGYINNMTSNNKSNIRLFNSSCDDYRPTQTQANKLFTNVRDKTINNNSIINLSTHAGTALSYDPNSCTTIKNNNDLIYKCLPFETIFNCKEDKYKVSVVISLKNRTKFLKYSLSTLEKQTLPKSEFELIFVDDGSTEDIAKFLESYSDIFNIKYIKIDSSKSEIPAWSHTPSLSNNVGFKAAEGSVIVICGPEILHAENNLSAAYASGMSGVAAFGIVYHSNLHFVHNLFQHEDVKNITFKQMFDMPGAKHNCISTKGFWWFLLAVKKSNIMAIGGVDEEYLRGVCAEDDDFAARLNENKTKNIIDNTLVGIHMEHESEDDKYDKRRHRQTPEWQAARAINTARWEAWQKHKTIVANKGRDWGSYKVITEIKTMKNGIISDYRNYKVTTKYKSKKLKVMYLPLGDQCGMIKGFNDLGVDLEYIDIIENRNCADNMVLNLARRFKPDLLHMQLQFNPIVSIETIRRIKNELPQTIISNWSGDVLTPVPDYFVHIGMLVDYNLLSNTGQLEECQRRGSKNTKYWQVGALEEITYPIARDNFDYYISFLGTIYNIFPEGKQSRLKFANALKGAFGKKCGIFGHNWPNNISSGAINPRECASKIYTNSVCVLNISNFNTISDYFSDRFVACMCSGRPVISLYFPNIEKYIINGFNGFIVKTPEEAINTVNYLINNLDKAKQIGSNGARFMLEEFTFTHKILELIKMVGLNNKL